MKKSLVISCFICTSFAFTDGQFILQQTVPAKANQITTDQLGNFYLVKNDVLEKYDAKGAFLKSYSNLEFGKIDLVDVNNPMKILLFYRNFSQVVFLDNTLSLNGEPVSIEQLGFRQSPLIASSYNNSMWIYNQQNFELSRLDLNLQQTQSTGNISQIIGAPITPTLLTEYNNKVYLNDPEKGILVFDVYGTYSKTIPLKNISLFQVSGDNIVYIERKQIMSFNTKTLAQDSIILPDTSATALRIEKDKLFLLSNSAVRIYNVK